MTREVPTTDPGKLTAPVGGFPSRLFVSLTHGHFRHPLQLLYHRPSSLHDHRPRIAASDNRRIIRVCGQGRLLCDQHGQDWLKVVWVSFIAPAFPQKLCACASTTTVTRCQRACPSTQEMSVRWAGPMEFGLGGVGLCWTTTATGLDQQ